jgi:hypothetical protein
MARTRGRRNRGRARGAPANRGGRRGSRGTTSGAHSPKSLIVTLHVRAPQPVEQLPTPESTNLSIDSPASQQGSVAQVAGEGEDYLMAPVKDPNNVDGMQPNRGEICWSTC